MDRDKNDSFEPFDPEIYQAVDLDRLVIYTLVELDRLGIPLSLENIIVRAYRLFPKKFSLLGYPEYPDATRVEKALWRSKGKAKQWIGGKTAHGYLVTDRTRRIAAETEAQLSHTAVRRPRSASKLRRGESILREIRSSSAYRKFLDSQSESISAGEFCFLLQGTLDSTRESLRRNFASLRTVVHELQQDDLQVFLDTLQERFEQFLSGDRE